MADRPDGRTGRRLGGRDVRTPERCLRRRGRRRLDGGGRLADHRRRARHRRLGRWATERTSDRSTGAPCPRSASVSSATTAPADGGLDERTTVIGVVGELDPYLVGRFGLLGSDGRPRRLGWLDLDIGILLDRRRVPATVGRGPAGHPVPLLGHRPGLRGRRTPSPAGSVERTLRSAGGDLLESVALFDVYRGPSVDEGRGAWPSDCASALSTAPSPTRRSGRLRSACIDAVVAAHRARLR